MKFKYVDKVVVGGESFHRDRKGIVKSFKRAEYDTATVIYTLEISGLTYYNLIDIEEYYLRHATWFEEMFWWFL